MTAAPSYTPEGNLVNASREHPCPICDHTDHCSLILIDGEWKVAMCRRPEFTKPDLLAYTKMDSKGTLMAVHHAPGYKPPREVQQGRSWPVHKGDYTKADTQTLHRVYSELLSKLTLSPEDYAELVGRGYSQEMLKDFKSFPTGEEAKSVLSWLAGQFSVPTLLTVPGFAQQEKNPKSRGCIDIDAKTELRLYGAPGYYIPILDEAERVVGLQVRTRDPKAPMRYFFASTPNGGAALGTVVHVPRGCASLVKDARARVTEAYHKANIAQERTGLATVGAPNVGSISKASTILAAMGVQTVLVAADADHQTKVDVAQNLRAACLKLAEQGFVVELEVWPLASGKGIDDVLTANDFAEEGSEWFPAKENFEGNKVLTGEAVWKYLLDLSRKLQMPEHLGRQIQDRELQGRAWLSRLLKEIPTNHKYAFHEDSIWAVACLTENSPEHMRVVEILKPYLKGVWTLFNDKVEEYRKKWVGMKTRAKASEKGLPVLEDGSHLDIAERLLEKITEDEKGTPHVENAVFTEEQVYVYASKAGHWKVKERAELEQLVHSFKGAPILSTGQELKIQDNTVFGTINRAKAQAAKVDFFKDAVPGIGFRNGFFRADTLQLVPHSPQHKARHTYDFDYDPASAEPTEVLEVFRTKQWREVPDLEQRLLFLPEWCGATLMGKATDYQIALLFFGEKTQNGKSVTMEAISSLFPSGSTSSVRPENFSDRFTVAQMAGRLLNTADDVIFRGQLEANMINTLITGKGMVTAEFKGTNHFQYRPTAGHLWTSAVLPHSDDPTDGFRRRWTILEFPHQFRGADDIKGFMAALFERERAKIVNWFVQGFIRLVKQGRYTEVPSSEALKADWKTNSDTAAMWVRDNCAVTEDKDQWAKSDALYSDYKKYCEDNGHRNPWSRNKFIGRLKALGHHRHTKKGEFYALKVEPRADTDEDFRETLEEAAEVRRMVADATPPLPN